MIKTIWFCFLNIQCHKYVYNSLSLNFFLSHICTYLTGYQILPRLCHKKRVCYILFLLSFTTKLQCTLILSTETIFYLHIFAVLCLTQEHQIIRKKQSVQSVTTCLTAKDTFVLLQSKISLRNQDSYTFKLERLSFMVLSHQIVYHAEF